MTVICHAMGLPPTNIQAAVVQCWDQMYGPGAWHELTLVYGAHFHYIFNHTGPLIWVTYGRYADAVQQLQVLDPNNSMPDPRTTGYFNNLRLTLDTQPHPIWQAWQRLTDFAGHWFNTLQPLYHR